MLTQDQINAAKHALTEVALKHANGSMERAATLMAFAYAKLWIDDLGDEKEGYEAAADGLEACARTMLDLAKGPDGN